MLLTEYSEEFHLKAIRKEGVAEGREEGRTESREEISLLFAKLLELGRLDDLKRAAADFDYQEQLMKEFGIGK